MLDIKQWLDAVKPHQVENTDEITSSSKKYKIDLFSQVLPALDRKDYDFYKNLTEEQKSEIDIWMVMRWLASFENDNDTAQNIILINEIVNNNFSSLSPRKMAGFTGHKELQWMLLASCGSKRQKRRKFIKPAKGSIKNHLEEIIIQIFPHFKQQDIDLFLKINTNDDIVSMLKENGFDDKTINEIFRKNAKNK